MGLFSFPLHVGIRATDTPDNPGDEARALIVDRRGVRIAEICLHGSADIDNARADAIVQALNDPRAAFLAMLTLEANLITTTPERALLLRRIAGNVRKL